jgi:methionyl-tRNA formyltransferase
VVESASTAQSRAKALRIVFCGTPEFAVPTLAAIAEAGHEVALVLTQPDRPSGRGMHLVASPVKHWSLAHDLLVDQPEKIRNNENLRARLEAIAPDAIIVVAYGRIIPPWMLGLPPLGNINLHGSLLPKYRGAAPIQWAVARGEQRTGVTTMLLEEGLDTGPTLEHAELPIAPDATAAELFPQLAELGAPLLLSTLAALAAGTLMPQPQNHAEATYAPILTREDGRIDFTRSAQEIYNRWRGFQPWPGAWSTLNGKKFTIARMAPFPSAATIPLIDVPEQFMPAREGRALQTQEPGTLLLQGSKLLATCGHRTAVELLEVQLEGKRSTPAADFLRGHPHMAGANLG